ncbi:MAG: pyridoxal phosphate-dependent aminotransferase, partial [Thermoplasmatota archaeon]
RQGIDVVSFSLGEPDFDTPLHVREAAIQALREGKTHYVPGPGIPELRQAVAAAERGANGIPCHAEHVLVTPAKHGVFLSVLAVAGPGDDVLLPDPAWVSYDPIIRWAGASGVPVPLGPDNRMTPDAVASKITKATRAIILNSPSNPTGGVNTREDVKGILELACDHDLWILSDEIYQKILYDGATHHSPAALAGGFERTLTVNGLSKSFAMTGWRMGWVVAPPEAAQALERLQSQTITHVTSFAQYGAVAAVAGPQDSVESMRREFEARRDIMVQGLNALPGVSCAAPRGAFYAFPRFDPALWGADDVALADRLLQEAHVAATPGSAFGAAGRGHLRFSYATSRERIMEGLERLERVAAPLEASGRATGRPPSAH